MLWKQSLCGCTTGYRELQALVRVPNQPAWRDLTDKVMEGGLNLDLPLDELEVASDEEDYERGRSGEKYAFRANMEMEAPSDLYEHTDDSTTTRLHQRIFQFFAYIPVYFWKQAVLETNRYAAIKEILITTPITMDELMIYLGIMFYMTLTDKGEYSNYWGAQTEDAIFGGASTSLDNNVVSQAEMQQLREELEDVQQVRKHVLEVVRPCFFSRRIINMDNYYTSVQLLLDLELKGLYNKGGVISSDYQQSVAVEHNMLAASWCDGNIVTMVTNADPSTTTTVTRRIGASSLPQPAF
ncbi:hypothetical protein GQ600_16556 [Phytophthora cactorum]|nr:hypothetical protein GQ600_16556 [Phytophthora cactorum]